MASNNPRNSTSSDHQPSPGDERDDVAAAVDELLNSLTSKFTAVSNEILSKMDEMSRRIDKLEAELVESKSKEASPSKQQ